jgi:transposase-like protein
MKNQRRKFSTEFKTKVLQEVKLNETAIIAIAKKFDLSPAQIYSWKRKSDDAN